MSHHNVAVDDMMAHCNHCCFFFVVVVVSVTVSEADDGMARCDLI